MISIPVAFLSVLAAAFLAGSPEPMPAEEDIHPPPDAHLQPRPFPYQVLPRIAARLAWMLAYIGITERLLEHVEKHLKQRAAKSLPWWRTFWRLMVKKVGVKGSLAALLVAADGPMILGDLLAVGLTIWMIYDIYLLIEVVSDTVDKMESSGQLDELEENWTNVLEHVQ